VLGFLESNWIKGHVDGRLGVREYRRWTRCDYVKIDQKICE
jgi:hypothetical protein